MSGVDASPPDVVQIRPGARLLLALPDGWNPNVTEWRLFESNGRAFLVFCNPHHAPLVVDVDGGGAKART